jgi:hypothetical protein
MKSSVRWLLFEYKGRELVILSKGFKKLAEETRQKYPDRTRRKIGIGVPAQFVAVDLKTDLLDRRLP